MTMGPAESCLVHSPCSGATTVTICVTLFVTEPNAQIGTPAVIDSTWMRTG